MDRASVSTDDHTKVVNVRAIRKSCSHDYEVKAAYGCSSDGKRKHGYEVFGIR